MEECGNPGEAEAAKELGAAGSSARGPATSSQSEPRTAQAGSGSGRAGGSSTSGSVPSAEYAGGYSRDSDLDDPRAQEQLGGAASSTAKPGSGGARAAVDSNTSTLDAAVEGDYLANDSGDEAEAEEELEGAEREHSAFLSNAEWRARPDNATLQARGEAAAMGSFLADAATVGLHGCATQPCASRCRGFSQNAPFAAHGFGLLGPMCPHQCKSHQDLLAWGLTASACTQGAGPGGGRAAAG